MQNGACVASAKKLRSRLAVPVPAALWSVSDRATPATEGLPYRGRPSVGGFGGVRDPRRAMRL